MSNLLRFIIYTHYHHREPQIYSKYQRRWLQLLLVISEVYFYLKTVPRVVELLFSYYLFYKGRVIKNICYSDQQERVRQKLDLYPTHIDTYSGSNSDTAGTAGGSIRRGSPVILFVHGGAWGTNSKMTHHMIGRYLQKLGYVVVIPNYSRYPFGDIEDMIEDLNLVFEWILQNIQRYGGDLDRMICIGHSAGAHLIVMALIEKIFQKGNRSLFLKSFPTNTSWDCNLFKKYILMAGVYDISSHYFFEAGRAVEDLSTMKPAFFNNTELFPQFSPTLILEHFYEYGFKTNHNNDIHDDTNDIHEDEDDTNDLTPLEIETLESENTIIRALENFPPIQIMHSIEDSTVPASSSERFYDSLRKFNTNNVQLSLVKGIDHTEWATGLMGWTADQLVLHTLSPHLEITTRR